MFLIRFVFLFMLIFILIFIFSIILLSVVIAIPATLSLPTGRRNGIIDLSIERAADQLSVSRKTGWELVVQATLLVHQRIQYCRRNSFDGYKKAFRRGYGYCQQQAYALKYILNHLGFDAKVVHSLKNKFPAGNTGSHAWVKVQYKNEIRNYCPVFPDPVTANPHFEITGKVHHYNGLFRLFAGWGSIAVNAIRYYQTGKDS